MKKQWHQLLILALIGILMSSCETEDFTTNTNAESPSEEFTLTKLGDDLNVPYTRENMAKAYDQVLDHFYTKKPYGKSQFALKSNFALRSKSAKRVKIVPSHYYYRFLPKDSLEYETLVNDSILVVTNTPLHKEVLEEGDVYDDPEIEGDETGETFGWFYSVLPYNYNYPSHIQSEKLEDMYFAPELDEDEPLEEGESKVAVTHNTTTKDLLTVDENGEVFEFLELEALKLTNNLDKEELEVLKFYLPNDESGDTYSFEGAKAKGYKMPDLILDYDSVLKLISYEGGEISETGKILKRRRWAPSGKITVSDDVLNKKLPVKGAKVRVRKWGFLPIRKSWTNSRGVFNTRRTRTKRVKYSVVFYNSSNKFRVKAGSVFVNAKYRDNRRYKRRGWYLNFTSGRTKFYAQVHNATMDFYARAVYKFGLQHPNWRWIRISAKYNKQAGKHLDLNPGGRFSLIPSSEIRVGRLKKGSELKSDQIYALVIHEMTHASHYRLDRSFFINTRGAGCTLQTMAESWAEGVETVITNDRYLEQNLNYVATGALNRFTNDDRRLYNSRRQDQIVGNAKDDKKHRYTPIVIDLVDDFNQRQRIRYDKPIDRVKGYTLRQIQQSLNNARGPHTWKENLIKDHFNPTERYVEELFDVYMYDNCN